MREPRGGGGGHSTPTLFRYLSKMCRTGEYACDTCSTHLYITVKGCSFVYLRNCIFCPLSLSVIFIVSGASFYNLGLFMLSMHLGIVSYLVKECETKFTLALCLRDYLLKIYYTLISTASLPPSKNGTTQSAG